MPSVAASLCCSEVPEATERQVNGCLINNEQFELLCLDPAVLHLVFLNLQELGIDAEAVGNE